MPFSAATMAAMALTLPPLPTSIATGVPSSAETSASARRTCLRILSKAASGSGSFRTNRSVSVTAPMGSDRIDSISAPAERIISTEPPPTSTTPHRPCRSNAEDALRNARRPSSSSLATTTSSPSSALTRSMNAGPFAARRTADVAIARVSVTPKCVATESMRRSASIVRAIASSVSRRSSSMPWPRRVYSFSSSTIW